MDGMNGMLEEAPFMGNGGEELLTEDGFMVVPSLIEDHFQLDQFLLEANFAGVTGTILSPPSVDHVHQFCTNDGDVERQQAQDVQDFLFDQHQETFLQQHQLPHFFTTSVQQNGTGQFFDDNFNFEGGQETVQDENVVFDSVWQNEPEEIAVIDQGQIGVLEDPDSTWLAEPADLQFIEQIASENDQHCQLLDELLRDDQVFQESESSFDDEATSETQVSMASDILNEIYREAQQLDFSLIATSDRRPSRVQRMVESKSPHSHLADHDFGSAKRGRPLGSTKKRGVLKRDLKSKKQHQNREAALRYRLKKKAEKMEKEGELGILEKRNLFLKTEVHTLTAELKYMKELFVEFRKVKGL